MSGESEKIMKKYKEKRIIKFLPDFTYWHCARALLQHSSQVIYNSALSFPLCFSKPRDRSHFASHLFTPLYFHAIFHTFSRSSSPLLNLLQSACPTVLWNFLKVKDIHFVKSDSQLWVFKADSLWWSASHSLGLKVPCSLTTFLVKHLPHLPLLFCLKAFSHRSLQSSEVEMS